MMYSRTPKVLGGIQYTMNSSKTQVKHKLKSLNKRINSLNKRLTNNAPVAISSRNGSTGRDYYSTRGKERISNVSVLTKDFNVIDVFINPANSSLFPWLSGIGKKYDLYHFRKLKFSYIPALPTSEEGNVYIGLDYNTLDPSPSSSKDLCQLSHWTMNVVWKPSNITVDLSGIGWHYTRQGPVPNADYKTYDLGRIFFATEGISYTGTVGYVEVEYDVEFKRRQPDYIAESTPDPDTYPAVTSIICNDIASKSYSTKINSLSYSNNSIFIMNNEQGFFQVSKPVKVLINAGLSSDDYSVVFPVLGSSTSNSSYELVSNSYPSAVIGLIPSVYYKIYNQFNSTQSLHVSLLVVGS